MLLTSNVKG